MTPEALFTAALQLEAGWKVVECRFEGEPKRLLLKLDFEEGKHFGCPECGKLCATHDTSVRRWRHLDFFQYECLLEARAPRSNCPEHGVLSVAVPWAREGSGFTLLFEALVMLLCREMPMAAVAEAIHEHDTRLWRVAAYYVEKAHAGASWAQVRRISVDETSARRGHRYVTNVLDARNHQLLLMVEGRSADALEAFATELAARGGSAEQIELISMDMSPAYQSGARRFFPKAEIVFDHFHLMQMAGEALDTVRKQLAGEGAGER
jgi:transposase